MLNEIRALADLTPALPNLSVCLDPAHNFLLAMAKVRCARGQTGYLITGDKRHLITLVRYGRTRITSAKEAADILGMF